MILLFFRTEFAADAERVGAAIEASAAGPAAGALVGDQDEIIAILEMGDRVAERPAD